MVQTRKNNKIYTFKVTGPKICPCTTYPLMITVTKFEPTIYSFREMVWRSIIRWNDERMDKANA